MVAGSIPAFPTIYLMNRPEKFNSGEFDKQNLAQLVTDSVLEFFSYIRSPEQLEKNAPALTELIHRQKNDRRNAEEILAKYNPEQIVKALELEDVLKKLHGCVISFRNIQRSNIIGYEKKWDPEIEAFLIQTIRENQESEPEIMYVKDHYVNFDIMNDWLVALALVDAPVTRETIEYKGFLFPLINIYDLEIISTNNLPND